MKLRKIWRQETGSTAVMAAVVFAIVLAMSGMVVDLGRAYIEQSSLQNAMDSAAYAASTVLPVSVNDTAAIQSVIDKANEYVQKNGYDTGIVTSVDLEDIYAGKYYGVRVNATTEIQYYFGPIVGINGTALYKRAKTKLEPITSSTNVVPLGIEISRLAQIKSENNGLHLVVKYGGGGGDTGFFGALDLDGVRGGGAKDFESWLAFGYGATLYMDDVLPTESGNMAGPTADAFTTRYSQCTHFSGQGGCTLDHFEPDCSRVVTMLVYSMVGSKSVKVEGFVPFILEGINGNGEIIASMISLQTPEGETDGTLGGTGDYGIYKSKLVE